MFIIYLLFYRLERRLPTAIQLHNDTFFLFCKNGAFTFDTKISWLNVLDTANLDSNDQCWCLSDSSLHSSKPCFTFQAWPARLIHASSPQPEPGELKQWVNEYDVPFFFMTLPRKTEIAAIA